MSASGNQETGFPFTQRFLRWAIYLCRSLDLRSSWHVSSSLVISGPLYRILSMEQASTDRPKARSTKNGKPPETSSEDSFNTQNNQHESQVPREAPRQACAQSPAKLLHVLPLWTPAAWMSSQGSIVHSASPTSHHADP